MISSELGEARGSSGRGKAEVTCSHSHHAACWFTHFVEETLRDEQVASRVDEAPVCLDGFWRNVDATGKGGEEEVAAFFSQCQQSPHFFMKMMGTGDILLEKTLGS